jgi:hypothetical protein
MAHNSSLNKPNQSEMNRMLKNKYYGKRTQKHLQRSDNANILS